jgi:hypothetical protein
VSTEKHRAALVPVREQVVNFYDDQIPGAVTQDGEVFIPLRPVADALGLAWSPQRIRVMQDEVLAARVRSVRFTAADGKRYATLALPLDLIPGWLFSISPARVKPDLAEKLRRYRAECFRVLWQAFKGDVLPSPPASSELSGAALAYEIGTAIQNLARQQMDMEARIGDVAGRQEVMAEYLRGFIQDTRQRLTVLELHTGATAVISDGQAAEITLAVKNVGQALAARGDKNGYAQVYSEMYRRYRISSYKNLPAARYDEVIAWLAGWYGEMQGDK